MDEDEDAHWMEPVRTNNLKRLKQIVEERGMEVLEDSRLDFHGRRNNHTTPLFEAVRCNSIEIAHYLVKECAVNVDKASYIGSQRKRGGWKPLHLAVSDNNMDLTKFLVEEGNCDVNGMDDNGDTALHVAVRASRFEAVHYLFAHGCNGDIENHKGETALTWAIANGTKPIVEVILYIFPKAERADRASKVLFLAVQADKWGTVHSLVKTFQADANTRNEKQETILFFVSELFFVQMWIQFCGADVHARNVYNETPHFNACRRGDLGMVEYMVESARADPHATSVHGETPFSCACTGRAAYIDIVQYLVEQCSVDTTVQSKVGLIPLHAACRYGKLKIVEYLIQHCRADIHAADTDDRTALHEACRHGHLDIAKFLVESGAIVHARSKTGWTPLHEACSFRCDDEMLIGSESESEMDDDDDAMTTDAESNAGNDSNDGTTTLLPVAQHMYVALYLVQTTRVSVEAQTDNGQTPLHIAAEQKYMDLVLFLVTHLSSYGCDDTMDCDTGLGRRKRQKRDDVPEYR